MNWIQLKSVDLNAFNSAEAYIHRAVQFLAMVGKHYVPDEEDDSNTNLEWVPTTNRIIGRAVHSGDPFHVSLNIENFSLQLEGDETHEIDVFDLNGKYKNQVFDWLKFQLLEKQQDTGNLDYITHYEVPEHPVDRGEPFVKPGDSIAQHWMTQRTNANEILAFMNDYIGIPSAIRIWPHHFDTGVYYPFGKTKAIGAGWAVADTLSDSPYLYVYGWDADDGIDYERVPDLTHGSWHVDDSWKGGILNVAHLLGADDQPGAATDFVTTTIDYFRKQLQV